MNLNVVISFLIGGLLLLAILTMNNRVIQNSAQTVVSMSAKGTVATINQIMRRDFIRLGYNLDGSCDTPVKEADNTEIVFCADVDTDPATTAKEISWEWNTNSSNKFTAGNNPDDYKLIRKVNGTVTSWFPATDFNVEYYDENGNVTTDESNIRSFTISLETEASVAIGNDGYAKSFLTKTFSPPNLNLDTFK